LVNCRGAKSGSRQDANALDTQIRLLCSSLELANKYNLSLASVYIIQFNFLPKAPKIQ